MENIRFELDPEDWHGHSSERLWAEPVLGGDGVRLFQVRNHPFFVTRVSCFDVVAALPDEDGELVFERMIEKSGHATVVVLVPIESKAAFYADAWPTAGALGCAYESGEIELSFGLAEMLTVDIPSTANKEAVMDWLAAGERTSLFLFQVSDMPAL